MSPKRKIILTFVVFCFLFALVLAKAFYVQVIQRSTLVDYSRNQFLRETKVFPNRGNIFDRNGTPLAINIHRYNVVTIPKLNRGNPKVYLELSKIIPSLPLSLIRSKIKGRSQYTWLARRIQLKEEQVERIRKLKGIILEEEYGRYYPNNELVSQVIGHVGKDGEGLAGIEYQFNEQLKGKPIVVKHFRDAKGRAIKFENSEEKENNKAPDITLSIDKEIQSQAEKYLDEAVRTHGALRGGMAVMDAVTGELLALANLPSFDPNSYETTSPEHRKMAFISDPFEPGSSFKSLTMASALENNTIKKDSKYYGEKGQLHVDNHIIREAEAGKVHEWMTATDILKFSSNIGISKIAFDLGWKRLRKTLKDFRIGEKTEIELPGESRGLFTDKDTVSRLSLSNMSFGQGIAPTALQMIAAYAVIANGGYYIHPTILKQDEKKATAPVRILSEKTIKQLTQMLVKAVEEGTGTNAKIPHYDIAGKTSTAQRVSSQGGYEGYIAGFIGFPVHVGRKFVISVYIDRPTKGGYYGNVVAAPVFKKMAQYILYKDKELARMSSSPNVEKTPMIDVHPIKEKPRKEAAGLAPSFIGLDKVSAQELARQHSLRIEHDGFGVVVSQEPAPGAPLTVDTVFRLHYRAPEYE